MGCLHQEGWRERGGERCMWEWMCLEEAVMEGEASTLVRYTMSVHMLTALIT